MTLQSIRLGSASRAAGRDAPGGMTLIELMLVLALLAVIGSLAMPIFDQAFASVQLRRAADQVLAAWSQARADAIDSGRIQQFRFVLEGALYRIDPWVAEQEGQSGAADSDGSRASTAASAGARSSTSRTASTNRSDDPTNAAREAPEPRKLNERFTFFSGEQLATDPQTQQRAAVTLQAQGWQAGENWSEPVLFFPDGSTSTASVVVTDTKRFVRLSLRGLTGVARASGVLTREELQRQAGR
jgi:prepilin-type N-terminal cleavage/methylation domain-containing protein